MTEIHAIKRPGRQAHGRGAARLAALLLGSASLLTACGGGDGGTAPVPIGPNVAQVQDTNASASVEGLIAFVRDQIARSDADTAEPRTIAGISAPVTDTGSPEAI